MAENAGISTLLMVRPAAFGYNTQTAGSNAFQKNAGWEAEKVIEAALREFDAMMVKLLKSGVDVVVLEDTASPVKPDAVFPNNWISFHEDGKVVLYPMMAPNRRLERRVDVLERLKKEYAFLIHDVIDITNSENDGKYLEGTGSIIFDYYSKTAYVSLSPRTNASVFRMLCNQLGYKPIAFTATDKNGKEIYHTNVLLSIGEKFAVLCEAAIGDEHEHQRVVDTLERAGKEVITISFEQMENFCANIYEVQDSKGEKLILLSETALRSLKATQLRKLEKYGKLIHFNIPTIEKAGGGSCRCMIADIRLPKKSVR